ncbi:MAG: DUF4349 domain-containing protein [Blastocatellia bacterium]|nr:DUF4349 domain-containing protein [Blastocatellia bacterium]
MSPTKEMSLTHLLIGTTLLAILAAIAIPNLLAARRSANAASAQQTLRNLNTAQVSYSLGIGRGNYADNLAFLGGSASTSVGFLDNTVTAAHGTNVTGTTVSTTAIHPNGQPFKTESASPKPNGKTAFAATIRRKIVKNGEIALVIKAYEPFATDFSQQVARYGGYISQSQVRQSTAGVAAASLVVRIPPDALEGLVSWLRFQGQMTAEAFKADDISEEYYDFQARLQNAHQFETRLLTMLSTQTGTLQDVVTVEEKLNQVREQIEQMEGKIRSFDSLVGLSTLALNVSIAEHYVPPHTPTFRENVLQTWNSSWQGLLAFAQGFGLFVVGWVPWCSALAVLTALGWGGFRLTRRGRMPYPDREP